ncbi:MAG TPA: transporter substrate-binding domain-containing protein [Candidatus Limnocylindria bacterium]|nr:transporter substrate-binding domain-containing protein [Candidatus Limnocylindria bacterium]
MRTRGMARALGLGLALLMLVSAAGLAAAEKVTDLSGLEGKVFAVPAGTVADRLVLSRYPGVTFLYFGSALEAALAVQQGLADAAAYDEPILRNIAAKNPGLTVLPGLITADDYGFAVQPGRQDLKDAIDKVVNDLKASGKYDEMLGRWLPAEGEPGAMPEAALPGGSGTLRFGTAAVTEPFSFLDAQQRVVGLDVELAALVAQELGMGLEIVNMDFGVMIPALIAGEVDMIGACITITPERAAQVLFSEPYYTGGIAALVRK